MSLSWPKLNGLDHPQISVVSELHYAASVTTISFFNVLR